MGWAGLARARAQWDGADTSPPATCSPSAAAAAATPAAAPTTTSPATTGSYEETGEAWWKRGRDKYGKYLLWQRFNGDQVPMPFVCDMDYTLWRSRAQSELLSTNWAHRSQSGSALQKSYCGRHHRHRRLTMQQLRSRTSSTRRILMSCRSTRTSSCVIWYVSRLQLHR